MFTCGEKDWHDRDLIGMAAIVSGYALDGIGCLSMVNIKRRTDEADIDYRGRVMARLMEIGASHEAS
ncbi:hypothetical protein SAMN05443245_5274 [Paraburkholderia fungorum]|uniref:Uncharacterized protein n=1 Tax=Paraburkholderia fungorum TaxID=134537 RepID=A0A1H1IJR7_9BURK|nr:hypothetical protein SAMN05443245_5274 [Paraburkholderia fungorum]